MAIQNHTQARTAEQYLAIINEQLMDETLDMDTIIAKSIEAEDIMVELQRFHHDSSIKLVVDYAEDIVC